MSRSTGHPENPANLPKPTHETASPCLATPAHLLAAGTLLVAIISIVLLLFVQGWGRDLMADLLLQPGGWIGALLVVAASAILHELLHVLGWYALGRVPWTAVSVVPTWRGLGLAALLNAPVSMSVFRTAALIPAALLGILPLGFALMTGSGLVALWGSFFLFECITDLALLMATRALPSAAQVVSHPTELGCVVN